MATKAQRQSARRVNAQLSTRNLVQGIKGLLLNETLTIVERATVQAALAGLQDNLDNWGGVKRVKDKAQND